MRTVLPFLRARHKARTELQGPLGRWQDKRKWTQQTVFPGAVCDYRQITEFFEFSLLIDKMIICDDEDSSEDEMGKGMRMDLVN